jgi:hypothetical protein
MSYRVLVLQCGSDPDWSLMEYYPQASERRRYTQSPLPWVLHGPFEFEDALRLKRCFETLGGQAEIQPLAAPPLSTS